MFILYRIVFPAETKYNPIYLRQPIRYVTLHFEDRHGAASLSCRNRADRNNHYPVECEHGLKIITEKHAGLHDHINITLFHAMEHFNISTTILFLLCLKSVFLTFMRLINVSKGKVSFLLNLRNMGCY